MRSSLTVVAQRMNMSLKQLQAIPEGERTSYDWDRIWFAQQHYPELLPKEEDKKSESNPIPQEPPLNEPKTSPILDQPSTPFFQKSKAELPASEQKYSARDVNSSTHFTLCKTQRGS